MNKAGRPKFKDPKTVKKITTIRLSQIARDRIKSEYVTISKFVDLCVKEKFGIDSGK